MIAKCLRAWHAARHVWVATWDDVWLTASPLRAAVEALAAQCVLLLWGLHANGRLPLLASLMVLIGPCSILWCVFRARLGHRVWWNAAASVGAAGVALAVAPSILITYSTHNNPYRVGGPSQYPAATFFAVWLAAFAVSLFVSRIGVVLLVQWNRLRRQRLVWSLTHAHLVVVVIGASLLSAALVIVNLPTIRSGPLSVLPMLFVFFIVTVVALLIVLPLSFVFSYLFAHRTTTRLRALTQATSAMRSGNYDVRLQVDGEDEVAVLQSNFNAMATDLDKAIRALATERDTVTALLAARRELIANVSHELRTPVATLRGYLESTRIHWDGAPPQTLHHDMRVMEGETIRLQTLIDDLFTLARAEVGRLDLHCAPTNVVALTARVVETMAPLAWHSGRVEVVAEECGRAAVAMIDPGRFEQVLRNILHNAVRHTPPGGIVAAAVAPDPDGIVVRIRDTGEGIAASDLERIWERFYRTECAATRSNGGAGLGLALVKELTEAMGGSVAATSVLGEGTCVTLRLPLAAQSSAKIEAPAF